MRNPMHPVVRAGLIGSAAIVATALAVLPATAASAPLEYLCDYYLPGGEGSGIATASFDTGIGDDVVVNVGDEVSLDPVTGSITLPSGFVDALRDAGTLDIEGGGDLTIVVAEHDNTSFGGLSFEATPVPETGPMTLQIEGTTWPIEARDPGTHSLVLVDFSVIIGELLEEEEDKEDLVAMFCYLEGVDVDSTLDSFEVLRPVTPTTTVTTTATATATRTGPVVETDRPSGGSGNTLFASAGAAAVLVGAGALLLGRRQGNHR